MAREMVEFTGYDLEWLLRVMESAKRNGVTVVRMHQRKRGMMIKFGELEWSPDTGTVKEMG